MRSARGFASGRPIAGTIFRVDELVHPVVRAAESGQDVLYGAACGRVIRGRGESGQPIFMEVSRLGGRAHDIVLNGGEGIA